MSDCEDEIARLRRALDLADTRLRSEREKYRLLIEQSNVPFAAISRDGMYLAISRNSAERIRDGASVEDIVGHHMSEFLDAEITAALSTEIEAICESGLGRTSETSMRLAGGTRWYSRDIQPLFDETGRAVGVHIVGHDITHLHETQARLEDSLREKETLLREVHHRVKNNLQVISSLLSLQAAEHSTNAERKLRESADRVRLIARIHERLYNSRNSGRVDFRELADNLVRDAVNSYDVNNGVRPELDVQSVYFTTELAIPAGLILHELTRKAIEYGFGSWPGALTIQLTRDDSGVLVLYVRDPGRDTAERFPKGDMSMALVQALVAQLGAALAVDKSEDGFAVSVRFEQLVAPPDAGASATAAQ